MVQQQIEAQRKAIESQKSELESARKSTLLRQARELRSTGLTERGQRQAVAGKISKASGELTGAETEFETEVAVKAPEYGKEEYVEPEYQKAKKILDEKIEKENQRIKDYEEKIRKLREKEQEDRDFKAGYRIDDLEDDINETRARISGYSKAYGDKATTIKNVNTGYADSLANYEEEKRQARNDQQERFRELKKKPEFTSQLDTLGLSGNVTLSQYEQGVSKYNQNVAYLKQLGKWSEKIGIENVPQFARDKLGIPTMPEGEKLVIEYKDSMPLVKGISSSAFQQSFSVENYNKRIEQMNIERAERLKPFTTKTVLTSGGLKEVPLEFKPREVISTYTKLPEKNIFQEVRQKVSNVFTEKFRVTPSEVGSGIKDVGKGVVTGSEYITTLRTIGSVPIEISSKYAGGSYDPISVTKSVGGFLQEATVSRLESERNIKQIEKLNRDYNLGKIDYDTYVDKYNKLIRNPYLSSMSSGEAIEKFGTEKEKFASEVIQKGLYLGGYAVPYVSTAYLLEDVIQGGKEVSRENYLGGGLKLAVGVGGIGFKLFSAFKPVVGATQLTKSVVPTMASKIWMGTKLTAGLGLVGYTGYSTYKRTDSVGATLGSVVGTVAVPLLIGGLSRQISSRVPKAQFYGKSEREYMNLVKTQRRVENIIAEQRAMSQSLWKERVRALQSIDRNVASQIKRYGDIPVKSATESIIKFGNVRTLGVGTQETSKKEAIKVLETVLPIKDKALKTSDVRITFRDTTISQRPILESLSKSNVKDTVKTLGSGNERIFNSLYGDKIESVLKNTKTFTQPSNKLKSLFPDLFQTQKIREFQAVLGVKTKVGYTGFATSWSKDLVTGKVSKPTEFIKITAGKKSAIAEIFNLARTSTSRQGEFIITKTQSVRLPDIQVFKLEKPKIISRVKSPTGEIFELRETTVTSGVTKIKPTRLTPFEFAEKLNTRTRLDSVKDLGKFYTTKDTTLELIKYSNVQGRRDLTIVGTFADKKTAIKATETLFRQFKLGGTGKAEFLNPNRVEFIEGSWVSTKKLPDTGLVVLKDKGGEQIVKTVTQQVLETKTSPNVFVKTDVAKTIVVPRATQSQFSGTGMYETTAFALPMTGVLSLQARTFQPVQILQLETKVDTKVKQKETTLQLVKVNESLAIKEMAVLKERVLVKEAQKVAQALNIKSLQKLNIKQILQTKVKTVQKLQPLQRVPPSTRITIIKIPPIISIPLSSKGKLQRLASKVDTDEFKVFVRKQDKDIELGTFGTKERAKVELVKELKGTLRASGFIEKGGKKIKVRELGIASPEFRVGKREEFRLVQRKERRLGTRGETKEVQYFRKVRSKL